MAQAVALIEADEDGIGLEELAARVGYAPHHFHRLFKRATGVTPAAYARGLKAQRAAKALIDEDSVTQAIYEAGYSAPSRFYEGGAKRLGMTPSAWRKGGAGVTIRWTVADTSLGPMLVAATDKGLCRVSFDEDEQALKTRFPRPRSSPAVRHWPIWRRVSLPASRSPDRHHDLPLDVQGTAFQEAVWQALRAIPAGRRAAIANWRRSPAIRRRFARRAPPVARTRSRWSFPATAPSAATARSAAMRTASTARSCCSSGRGGMTGFAITGLDPAPFVPLYGFSDAELAGLGVIRMAVDAKPGFPCRISLEDAMPGDHVLLLNYEHLPLASPYRQRHAIFVRDGATEAARFENEVPDQLAIRTLSIRAYDANGMMTDADLTEGRDLPTLIDRFFGDPAVAWLHAHNAKRGCFAARIDRA